MAAALDPSLEQLTGEAEALLAELTGLASARIAHRLTTVAYGRRWRALLALVPAEHRRLAAYLAAAVTGRRAEIAARTRAVQQKERTDG